MAAQAATNPAAGAEVLIEEGLFRLDDAGQPRLLGRRCRGCQAVFLGRRKVCLACFGREMDDALLGPGGVVHSYTTVHQASPAAFVKAPYVIAQVRLPEGVIVTAPLVDCDPAAVTVGLPVETRALRFPGESDQVIVSYAFVPRNRPGGKESRS